MARPNKQLIDGSSGGEECNRSRGARPISHKTRSKTNFCNPKENSEKPKYSGRALNAALQDHDEVDEDEKVNMTNEDGSCKDTLAAPNQKTICRAPTRTAHEKWPKDFEQIYNERIISTLNAFRDSKYSVNTASKRPVNLVITDSLMSSIPFEKIYQKTVKLFVGYPNYPLDVVDQMKYQIEDEENDYVIKNILISIGFDALVYYPDFIEAKGDTVKFLNDFVDSIKKAFDKNGPKRYNQVKKGLEEDLKEKEATPTPIQPPKIIIATIPEIANHPTAFNYNMEIVEMNEEIKNFVNDTKASAFKKHNIVIELYDWAKFSSNYNKCNAEHLHARNRILTVDLAEQYTWLMAPRIAKNPAVLEQDSANARARRELMENNNILHTNNSKNSKSLTFASSIHQIDSDENYSSDSEMEVTQVNESHNARDSTINQENSSISQRFRKRKGSSENSLSPPKKSKRTPLRECESNSYSEDKAESDNEVPKEINSSLSILDPSKYELRHYNDGKICIFVFASNEEKTCYEFTKSSKYYYRCLGCLEKGRYVCVYLLEDETIDKYSVFLKDGHEHCCTPREYNPERFSKEFIFSSNFNFFREKNSLKAVTFDDEKKFCHKYSYRPSTKIFVCCQCRLIKKEIVILKRCRNDEGEEYLSPGSKKHICKPLKYAEVISNMELLSSSDIDFDKEKITVEEERQKPDPQFYELETTDKGYSQLFVYTSNEKLQWYKYYYEKSRDIFFCSKCTGQGRFITAKYVKKDSTNDGSFVNLGEREHVCEPLSNDVKFISNILDVEKLDKELYKFEKTKKGKPQLIIYTSNEKIQWYKYIHHYKDSFSCARCSSLKHHVTVKRIKESPYDDSYYVILGNKESHICEPFNNDSKIPAGKKIDKELFQFEEDKKGKTQLIIYTSNEKLRFFKYSFNKRDKLYVCRKCEGLEIYVSAKHVNGDSSNDDEYIILGKNDHICEPLLPVNNTID